MNAVFLNQFVHIIVFIQPPIIGAYLYDAVSLYGIALNRTLSQGVDPRDGKELMKAIFDKPFKSKLK